MQQVISNLRWRFEQVGLSDKMRGQAELYQHYLTLVGCGPGYTIIDYGAGAGYMGLLAKALGATVIYNDIEPERAAQAGEFAQSIGLAFDHIVCGEIDDVIAYTRRRGIRCTGLISHNVLEHIYDVPAFLCSLADIPGPPTVAVGSAANGHNPHLRRKLQKHHHQREYRGKTNFHRKRTGETTESYLEMRRQIIANYAPEVDANKLAKATRGLRLEDIERAVDEYRAVGRILYEPDGPTNTCDPVNGNWAEHLLDTEAMCEVLRKAGFDARVLAGYYYPGLSPIYDAIRPLLNMAIRGLGRRALAIAPYYILYGTTRAPQVPSLESQQ